MPDGDELLRNSDNRAEDPGAPLTTEDDVPPLRAVVEFFVLLTGTILLLLTFVGQGYFVPTGSMAPSLLGYHRRVECPRCGHQMKVGDAVERPVRCPNCGQEKISLEGIPLVPGDQLLVHKWVYDFRRPKRWETVVFFCPDQPRQEYVKRVVGLPGESIQLIDGDVVVDGEIQSKDLEDFLSLRLPVYDHNHQPSEPDADSRWRAGERTAWSTAGSKMMYESASAASLQVDYLTYHHSNRGEHYPVVDCCEYNTPRPLWEHVKIHDLMLQFDVERADGDGLFEVVVQTLPHVEFVLRFDRAQHKLMLSRNGKTLREATMGDLGGCSIAIGYIDRRVLIAIDGEVPFDPVSVNYPLLCDNSAHSEPFRLGAMGLDVTIGNVRIDRDVYYSGRIGDGRPMAAIDKPYHLGPDEYFMLGDNSPISNDSRLWKQPGVAARLLIGKPVLVHLPSQPWQLTLFGRTYQRPIPDFANVRRIQ